MVKGQVQGETLKTLSMKYGVSVNTIKAWLKPYKKELDKLRPNKKGRIFTPAQVKFIESKLDKPE